MNYPRFQHVHFRPWRGRYYQEQKRRLLILGDSHYSDNYGEGPLFTLRLTTKYVSGKMNHRFWTQIGQVVTGKSHWEFERRAVWDTIAFYNYVQSIAVDQPGKAPPTAAFHQSARAFWEVIDFLQPTHLMALGARLWENMPPLDDAGLYKILGGRRHQYGFYTRAWGKVAAPYIKHPSWGFSAPEWHLVLCDFLALPK